MPGVPTFTALIPQ